MATYTVDSGVTSKGIILKENDFMNVTSKGKASNTTVSSGGTMRIELGGSANITTVSAGGSMYIVPGGKASNTTVNNGGLYQAIGGSAISTTINSGGELQLMNGGYAYKTEVNSDGQFYVPGGNSAMTVTVHNGGLVYVASGGILFGTMKFDAGAIVSAHEGSIVDFNISIANLTDGVTKVVELSDLSIVQGAPTYTLTVDGYQAYGIYRLIGNAAGFDKTITVKNKQGEDVGTLTLEDNSLVLVDRKYILSINASSELVVTVSNVYDLYGRLEWTADLTAGMIASGVRVCSGGRLKVLNGGSASMTTIESNGLMYVSDGGFASKTSINDGIMHVSNGGSASMTTIYGIMHVSDGGKADGVTVGYGGKLNVSAGGTVNTTTVASQGSMYVSDGGKADDVTVGHRACLFVSSGGTATQILENGGYVNIDNGATVTFLPNSFGGYTYTFASATIHSGNTGTNLSANEWGKIYVIGGTAENTAVGSSGYLYVSSGGVANGATVNANGKLEICDGGKLTGKMSFEDNAVVSAYEGSIIDFDISGVSPNNDPLVNNLSLVQGAPACTLTVNGSEAAGDYKLAEGAAGFNKTIKVVNALGAELGTLTVDGGATTIGGKDYTLTLTDGGTLGVTVAGGDHTPPVVFNIKADITGPTNQNVTVTAEFSDDVAVASRLYGFGDGNWQEYTGGVTVTGNEMIHFKAVDTSGNESNVEGIFIDYIDKVAPVVTDITPSTTEPDAASVTVTATFSDNKGLASKQYRIGDGDWQDYPDGGVTVTRNATVYFKATDTAGNETTASCEVTNIAGSPVYDLTGDLNTEYELTAGKVGSSVNILNGGELHVSNGAQASQTVMNSGGSMLVSQGGSADVTTVNSGGDLYVENGGTATQIRENGGYVWIHDNATWEFLPNSFGGYSYEGWDWATIHSGTTGTDLTVWDGGNIAVYYGGLASRTTVNSDGIIYVSNVGSADVTTVNSGGSMRVSAGGTATKITENGGYVEVNTGATAEFAANEFTGLVLDQFATVHSGTTATDATLNLGGLLVYDGGLANGVTVKKYGRLSVYDGGKVTGKVMFERGARVTVENGAILDFDLTQTAADADVLVNDLSFVKDLPLTYTLTVNGSEAAGDYKLAEGAAGFNKTIKVVNALGAELGTLTVSGGTQTLDGRDYTLTLTDSGTLGVTVAGDVIADTTPPVVSNIKADITGPTNQNVTVTADFSDDVAVASRLYRISDPQDGVLAVGDWQDYTGGVTVTGSAFVFFKAVDTSGNESNIGSILIDYIDKIAPTVTDITPSTTAPDAASVTVTATFSDNKRLASKQYRIGDGAWLDYPDGGVTVTRNATVYFKATDTAGNETTASCEVTNIAGSPVYDLTGDLNTEYELTAGKVGSSVNILSGGRLIVDDNANAEAVTVNAGGFMSVTSGGTATRIRENGGYVYIGRRDIPSGIFVPNEFSGLTLDGSWTTIHSGTTAIDTTLGFAGTIFLYDGGSAKGTTVNSGGALHVYSGGSTSQTTVNPGGEFFVYSGGTATQIVENGGYVNVDPSAVVEFASHEFSGVVYNDQFGRATIHSGTTGTDLTFTSDAQGLYVCSGGIAKNIGIDAFAYLEVYNGGIAKNIDIASYASLEVYNGGKVTGKMTFGTYAQVFAYTGAILDFDLTQTTAGADALVNNLAPALATDFDYMLTVSGSEAAGNYKLAGNAAGFDKTITVVNTAGENLGTLTVGGDTLFTKSSGYTLTLGADNTLSVDITTKSVSGDDTTPPVISNVAANITAMTLGSVTVTADFDDDVALASKQYRIGASDWQDYTTGVTVTTNTTVYFKAVDTAGNETTASYEVTNIIPPVAPDLTGDLTASYDLTAGKVGHDVNILDGGELNVSDGGTVENTTVNNGGELNVSSGGKLTGKVTFENGATVTAETGAVFDFDLTQTTPGADALVKNLSLVLDQPFTYTITVDNTLDQGTYKLASGAEGFNKPVTLMSVYGENGGTYTVEAGTTKVGDAYITLALDGSDLTFTISEYNLQNKPDDGANDFLWTKKDGWNDTNILVNNFITGDREINLDERGTIDKDGKHNMFGNDGTKKDTGDVAKIDVNTPAKLTFTIDSTAAGTFYVYEDGVDKKGKRTQITVAKVTVKKDQTTTLKDVCLTATGKYYVAMTAKNVKKAGTEGLYNVNVTTDKFFADADSGDNNEAKDGFLATIGRGSESVPIILDSNSMTGSTEFKNFVGFTDPADYLKMDLLSSAYLKFRVTGEGDGKAKFTVWKRAKGTTGKLSKVTSVSLPAKKVYEATTKAQFLDASKYDYYFSMECTDAAKGKGVYYNVQVTPDTVFFDSADNGRNDVLYDKKAKAFYAEDADHHFETTSIGGGTKAVKLDSDPVGDASYENFVGYGDPADYAKIELTTSGDLYFKLKASGNATFTVYEKTQDKKGKDTLKAIQTTKLTLAKSKTTVEATTDLIADLAAGEYYVSMTAKSTKANASGSVFYNVTANLNPSVADALSMPETDALAMPMTDSLGISDALCFGGYDADALASASTASLADLNEKSGWQSLLA